jgi:hypothetical protein
MEAKSQCVCDLQENLEILWKWRKEKTVTNEMHIIFLIRRLIIINTLVLLRVSDSFLSQNYDKL